MAQVSKLVAELALSQAQGQWLTKDDCITLAHMLAKHCANNLAWVKDGDDYGVVRHFLSRIDELPGEVEVAFEEADCIRKYMEPQLVRDFYNGDWNAYRSA